MYVYNVHYMCVCMFTTCMPVTQRGQKRTFDLLELELQKVVNCHMGARN